MPMPTEEKIGTIDYGENTFTLLFAIDSGTLRITGCGLFITGSIAEFRTTAETHPGSLAEHAMRLYDEWWSKLEESGAKK